MDRVLPLHSVIPTSVSKKMLCIALRGAIFPVCFGGSEIDNLDVRKTCSAKIVGGLNAIDL